MKERRREGRKIRVMMIKDIREIEGDVWQSAIRRKERQGLEGGEREGCGGDRIIGREDYDDDDNEVKLHLITHYWSLGEI